jgi:hypothetical protein
VEISRVHKAVIEFCFSSLATDVAAVSPEEVRAIVTEPSAFYAEGEAVLVGFRLRCACLGWALRRIRLELLTWRQTQAKFERSILLAEIYVIENPSYHFQSTSVFGRARDIQLPDSTKPG